VLNVALVSGFGALQFHYLVAPALAFPIVLMAGYFLHVRLTFHEVPSWGSFARYALAMASNYPLLMILLFLLCGLGRLPVGPATGVATIILFVWNFCSARWAVSRPSIASRVAQTGQAQGPIT